MVEHGGFYRTSDQTWVKFERIQFVGACNPPTDPGRKPLSHRFVYMLYSFQDSLFPTSFQGFEHLTYFIWQLTYLRFQFTFIRFKNICNNNNMSDVLYNLS